MEENSHEGQAVGMRKLSDMEAEFDGRSSGIRKGVGILVTNKAFSQLELFCRCYSLLQERQDIATLTHNSQSGILKVKPSSSFLNIMYQKYCVKQTTF